MNKRKRDNETIDSNNSIDNNNNNNNNNNDNKARDYNKITLKELKDIAIENGLSTSGTKKKIYDRVQNDILYKKKLKLEQDEKESINSFNKYQPELSIKDITPLERMFWSIFRNKVIFKSIFSNFQYNSILPYSRLYSISYILSNYSNAVEIIKDKVKNKEYLVFDCKFITISDPFELFEKTNKDTLENQLFYKQLVEHYIGNSLINVDSLKLFIYIHPNSHLIKYYGNEIKQYIKSKAYSVSNYYELKMVKLLGTSDIKESILLRVDIYGDSFKLKHLLSVVSLLQEIGKLNTPTSTYQFTQQQLKSTIFELLHSTSALITNNKNNNNNSSSSSSGGSGHGNSGSSNSSSYNNNNNNNQNDNSNNNQDISLLKKEISSIIESIREYIIFNQPAIKDNFIHYYLFNTRLEISSMLHNLYNSIETIPKTFLRVLEDDRVLLDLEFIKDEIQYIKKFYGLRVENFIMASLKNGNSELIDTVLSETISYIESKNIYTIISGINKTSTLDHLYNKYESLLYSNLNFDWIHFRTLELLKYYENQMKSLGRQLSIKNLESKGCHPPTFYNNIFKLLSHSLQNPDMYIEVLPNNNYPLFLDSSIINRVLQKPNKQEDIIQVLSSFRFGRFRLCDLEERIGRDEYKNHKIVDWILKNGEVKSNQYDQYDQLIVINNNNNNNNNNSSSKSIQISCYEDWILSLYYKCNQHEKIFNIYHNNKHLNNTYFGPDLFQSLGYSFRIHKSEFLDLLLKYYKDSNITIPIKSERGFGFENKFNIYGLLQQLVERGDYNTLKHLSLHHPYIFKKKSASNPTGLDLRSLKKVLIDSIKLNNIHISQLLFNYVNLSKKELNEIKSEDGSHLKEYYLNKFN